MKHSKWIAAVATAGTLFAVSGAAHAIAPAAAVGLAALGGLAVGNAAAQASAPIYTVAPSAVIIDGAPATVQVTPAPTVGYYAPATDGTTVWVQTQGGVINYDHDGDGVLNHSDRFPNDGTRS